MSRYGSSRNPSATATSTVQRPLRGTVGQNTFRQFCYQTTLTQSYPSPTFGALAMIFSQIANATSFAALYDHYRVDYLEFIITPMFDMTTAALTNASVIVPNCYVVIDLDDSTNPSTLAELREYQSVQLVPLDKPLIVRFKPGVQTGAWNGSSVVSATHVTSPWINCAVDNIPHYGIKIGCDVGTSTQVSFQTWDIDLYCGVTLKGVR